ncbi:MAG: beta-lactamase family protein [Burkholderiaceae bacterium]|jgi:CubicO group peptidase (beta-lactamase class C family)|nr:beta-lactamase family protein [Burkholderiaceae bacterium]
MLLEPVHRRSPSWRGNARRRLTVPTHGRQGSRRLRPKLIALLFACAATVASAQAIDSKALASRPLSTWTKAEREFGFAHWDELYPARVIARGPTVHAQPQGPALTGFEAGGTGALRLQRMEEEFGLAGIVVLHRGQLRLEHYAHGRDAGGRWVSFSVAKSLTGTLVGAAIRDGFIASVDDEVTRYVPELKGSVYESVTLRHLLTMTSGVQWSEGVGDPASDLGLLEEFAVQPGLEAVVSYLKTLRRAVAPGARWHYNSGETDLLGVVVSRTTRKTLSDYASQKIWAVYGMESDASWTLDRSGHEHGGGRMQASTRDYARFGQFILDGGRIDGRAVLPEGWLQAATRKQVDIGSPPLGYGYLWWTVDSGSFNAYGIHGQVIHIDPARNLVIAMNSATEEANFLSPALAPARIALFNAIRAALDAEAQAPLKPR